jgi:hypothetical protein
MAWYDHLPWIIPSPLQPGNNDDPTYIAPVVHQPVVTRRGRVVYDRRIHFFTERDVLRISSHYLGVNYDKYSLENKYFWLEWMERITIWMLDKVISFFTGKVIPDEISERFYYLAKNFLARIIDNVLNQAQQEKLRNDVSGGAH